ncbi:gp172 [Bacillus phage W.Ph.]|uniref:Gp172 n=1 Tax=Bacillus phage W.Ph. TaxID=764595 RepID=G9B1S3_9CAUD|nr:gp172 [Bacillus phage W.Ph.]ADH03318.1 gp172 [Bacillus phage W.Ph.]
MDWKSLDDKTFIMKVKEFVKGYNTPRTTLQEVVSFNETLDIIDSEYEKRFYISFYDAFYELLDIDN